MTAEAKAPQAAIALDDASSAEEPNAFAERFQATDAPSGPGCYVMLDAKEKPIYIGKAKNLRARIRAYLNETDSRYSVKFLMRRVHRIEFLVTQTEKEALLLENSLIKQHRPRYNVQLKDDKTFISLRIDPREDFPRITVVRRHGKDCATYFGPYHQAQAVRKTLQWIHRLFPLRTCSDHVLHNRTRPCLYHQMKQCPAPCVGAINREEYHQLVTQALLVLEGKSAQAERLLLDEIKACSDKLDFERAAVLRDRLLDLRGALERQRTVEVPGAADRDVFGLYNEGRFSEIQVLFYRGGKLIGGKTFSFNHHEMPADELLGSFILQYYTDTPVIPSEILTPIHLEESGALASILSEKRQGRAIVICPQRGEKRALVGLAQRNARRAFQEKRLQEKADEDLLEQLRQLLHLPAPPRRIECFDISNLQGTHTVASMAVFEEGRPAPNRYRRFKIKSVEGQDDFGSLREALTRRYTRAVKEQDMPGLVLIDGGRGQLGVARAVLADLGIEDLPCASIAKSRLQEGGGHSSERCFIPGRANPIILPGSGPITQLLARIRDEAHRFAVTYHRKRRGQATLRTDLEAIPGIGPKRARALLRALGSAARLREATVEEIAAVEGFSETLAREVHRGIRRVPE